MPCFSSLRNPVYRTAHQPRGCNWGDTHGFAVRIWGCQLSVHLYVLLSQVTAALWNILSTFLRLVFCFSCGIDSSFLITFFSESSYCLAYMLEPFPLLKHILLIQASLFLVSWTCPDFLWNGIAALIGCLHFAGMWQMQIFWLWSDDSFRLWTWLLARKKGEKAAVAWNDLFQEFSVSMI